MSLLIQRSIRPLPQLAHLGGRTITAAPFAALRNRYRRAERLSVSRWSDQHRIVTEIDAFPGDWESRRVPHTVPIMDAIGKPWVRKVCICMPERAAKTQILVNALGHFKDQGRRSGNIFLLYPTEADTKAAIGERIMEVFKAKHPNGKSGRLNRYVSSVVDHTTRSMVRFSDKTRMIGAWANSPTSMAKYFGRFNAADEIDKFPLRTTEGSDPISLFEKRAREDRSDSKYIYASTPGGRFIHKMTMECQQIITWGLRCPSCHACVVPGDDHVVIPEGTTLENIASAEIGLACPGCGVIWTEADRAEAYRAGREVIVKGADLPRPESVGAHCNAMQLPMIPLTEIAAKKLKAATNNHEAKVDYAHGYKVEDYKAEHKDRKEDAVLRLCDDRPAGLVPSEADILTIHIDTQDRGEWYTIRAWRFGDDLKSWLIKAGYVAASRADDFAPLDRLIFDSEYRDAAGHSHRISYGIIDSQGHRTAEVYAWCKRTGIFASRGAQKRKSQPVTVGKQDFYPGSNKQIPGGLNLYHLDTHFHKDMLANKLQIDPSDDGAWVLHSGYNLMQMMLLGKQPGITITNGLEEYAKQMCAEYRDEKGLWQCPDGKDNHLWDCEQMAIALANYLGFANMVSEKESAPEPPSAPAAGSPGRPSWFQNRRR